MVFLHYPHIPHASDHLGINTRTNNECQNFRMSPTRHKQKRHKNIKQPTNMHIFSMVKIKKYAFLSTFSLSCLRLSLSCAQFSPVQWTIGGHNDQNETFVLKRINFRQSCQQKTSSNIN